MQKRSFQDGGRGKHIGHGILGTFYYVINNLLQDQNSHCFSFLFIFTPTRNRDLGNVNLR